MTLTALQKEEILRRVRAIYDELEQRPVERQCTQQGDCCKFKLTGLTPYLTKGEALVAAHGFRASGRARLPKAGDGSCPLLGEKLRCMIYADRPFGCRTHFCSAAGGPYSRREVVDLIRRLEDIDRQMGGVGAVSLPVALSQALVEL